ncbi:N-acetylmuramoyl-L-alanine amidase [uncultured Acetatifactor sp.]|uniref:N-acetylmuramoyl-L-alanine amidase n=1 Tax=uncultured Acetatifactor sp. TaxID=1671927 RepID=UPI00261686CE|nr:N-acetylmuramoyl-L-alanine amidase [uncultured Acetatifactor sp.]
MTDMRKGQYRLLSMALTALLLAAMFFVGRGAAAYVAGSGIKAGEEREKLLVVIDAGHGGDDPGKVGINGVYEKDLNLQIAGLVKLFLEANDVEVVMTRDSDQGLYDADASNKKVQDMKRRIALIDEAEPALTVSIHQNSYPEEYVHGAQVFYYTGSAQGQRLAECIQRQLVERADPENKRQVKANDSYYLLKKTGVPIVIVECGFLSNSAEAEKLCTPEYQDRVAWAIHMGILQYLSENEK